MTGTDGMHRSDTALVDEATLALRRAAVRLFMRQDPGTQRAALGQAAASPRVVERAMKMILQPAMQDDGCQCGIG